MNILSQMTFAETDKEIVKLHIQPTVVILSMRVDETIEHYFDPGGTSRGSINRDGKVIIRHIAHQLILCLL